MSFDGMTSDLRFEQSEMAIDAARRGQGVVLTSPWLVEDDLERGSLIELFPHALRTVKSYYLVCSKDRPLCGTAQLFRDWLIDIALDIDGGSLEQSISALEPIAASHECRHSICTIPS
jgi:LysR family glycine cleavage system transcriptional activator